MHQKRILQGTDIAFVFLIHPDGKSSFMGVTYLQYCKYHGVSRMNTTTNPAGQGESWISRGKMWTWWLIWERWRSLWGALRIILLAPPLMVGNVASEILLRWKIELTPIHINNLLQAKCHLSQNLWIVRCPSWHGVQNCLKGHQPWPPYRAEHLLLGHWVKPRNGVKHVICCHPPWARIVTSFVKPWAWGVGDMHLPQWE